MRISPALTLTGTHRKRQRPARARGAGYTAPAAEAKCGAYCRGWAATFFRMSLMTVVMKPLTCAYTWTYNRGSSGDSLGWPSPSGRWKDGAVDGTKWQHTARGSSGRSAPPRPEVSPSYTRRPATALIILHPGDRAPKLRALPKAPKPPPQKEVEVNDDTHVRAVTEGGWARADSG